MPVQSLSMPICILILLACMLIILLTVTIIAGIIYVIKLGVHVLIYVKINKSLEFNKFNKKIYMSSRTFINEKNLLDDFAYFFKGIPSKYLKGDFVTDTHEIICKNIMKRLQAKGFDVTIFKTKEKQVFRQSDGSWRKSDLLEKCVVTIGGEKYTIRFDYKSFGMVKEKIFAYENFRRFIENIDDVKKKARKYKVTIPKELLIALSKE